MSLPNSRYPIANSHYFLLHAFNPFRHRRDPPVDRRCRKARHSSGAAGRDGDRRPNRRLPLRWQDRSADRARAAGAGRTPGVPLERQNHRGVPALCRSAHCRAGEAHADNQALSRDQRAARGAGALRSRRPGARRPAHGQRPERRGAEAALGGPRSGAVRGRRVRLRLTCPRRTAGGRGTAGGRAHGPAVYRSRLGRGGRHTRRRRMRPPDGSSHRWGRDGILRHGGAPGCGCDARVREPGRHASGAASPVLVTVVREELELKARVENADAVRKSILAAGAELVYRGAMMDRRFDRKGRLERRDEVVRLRVYHPADKSPEWGVLGWKGPVQLRGGGAACWPCRGRGRAQVSRMNPPLNLLMPRRVPELAPCLGRVIVPRRLLDPWVPLDDIREELATRVLELGGEGRAAAAREADGQDRARTLEVTGRRAWAAAWDNAVRRASATREIGRAHV